jgi:hypothetical protein
VGSPPYGRQLSFEEFRQILEDKCGCSFHHLARVGEVMDVDATPSPSLVYFERTVKGETVQAIMAIYTETQMMTRTVLRSTCSTLRIDPIVFKPYL